MQVLVVATHPDDEVLGCGGVIARHSDRGDQVHVLVVTRGVPELFPEEQIEETRRELRMAHQILGVTDVHFLDFPAPKLDTIPSHELADQIKKTLCLIQPKIVYFPHRGDIHADHRAVYHATLVAARPSDDCSVGRLLSYETLSETEWAAPSGENAFVPTVFIDITNQLERKLKAMACYQSQLQAAPHSRSLRSLQALAHLRGGTVGFLAAEAFMLVREVISNRENPLPERLKD